MSAERITCDLPQLIADVIGGRVDSLNVGAAAAVAFYAVGAYAYWDTLQVAKSTYRLLETAPPEAVA